MRLLVIMNPSAHDGEARRRWPQLERILRGQAQLTIVETEANEERTAERIRSELSAVVHDRVLAIGGDGTIRAVASAIWSAGGTRLPELAVIPFGTANDVARSLGLPLHDVERMAGIAVGHHLQQLDVARIRLRAPGLSADRIWLNCAGVGMDASIVASRQRYRELEGYLSYAAALVERSVEQRSVDVRIRVDDELLAAHVFNIVVTNVPVYAGALVLPGDRGDGLLDLHLFDRVEYGSKLLSYAIKKMDILKLGVGEIADAVTGRPRTLHGRKIQLRFAFARAVQVDGDPMPAAAEVDCDIVGRLQVLVP
ncbi:MAG: hypothetical protein HYV63_04025 [Candidatus Schekmanbacteria bacterium]|nr:hypothetical protein [Candidatus Schekmanbacteria bacterium]